MVPFVGSFLLYFRIVSCIFFNVTQLICIIVIMMPVKHNFIMLSNFIGIQGNKEP